MRKISFLAVFGISFVVGCGSTPSPKTPLTAVAAAPGEPADVASANYDLSPVPEPKELVGIVRWKNPSASFAAVTAHSNLPQQTTTEIVHKGLEGFVQEVISRKMNAAEFAKLISLDAPLDVAVTLNTTKKNGQPYVAFSLPLSSIDSARNAANANNELSPGVWRVGSKEDHGEVRCVIAASAGSAPARLICGDREKDATELAPFMSRTMPVTVYGTSELHGELRVRPIYREYGLMMRAGMKAIPLMMSKELSTGNKALETRVVDAISALGDEAVSLLSDIDKWTFDINSDSSSNLVISSSLKLHSDTSWTAGSIQDRAGQSSTPPALFWRLPKDADSASYSTMAVNTKRYEPIERGLKDLLEAVLADKKIGTTADRKKLLSFFDIHLKPGTVIVGASGSPSSPAPVVMSPQAALSNFTKMSGWSVIGFNDSATQTTKALKDLVSVYNSPSLSKTLKTELGSDAKFLPTVKLVQAPKQLGTGTLDIEIKLNLGDAVPLLKASPNAADTTLAFHIMLMPDNDTTWIAYGFDRDEIVKRLVAVKSGSTAETLASRGEMELLKKTSALNSGFMVLKPLLAIYKQMFDSLSMFNPSPEIEKMKNLLNQLPNRGETPIVSSMILTGGKTPNVDMKVVIPKGAQEDLSFLASAAIQVLMELNAAMTDLNTKIGP